jgi:lysozyme family protein
MKNSDIIAAAKPYGERFQKWLGFILSWEVVTNRSGNIITENVPGDTGGLTFAGLDKASHPNFDYANPQPEAVAKAYFWDYWSKTNADALKYPLGEVVANFGVNMGVNRAGRMLQTLLGYSPHSGAIDGIIGPKTVKDANTLDPVRLANGMIDAADNRYRALAKSSSKSKFLKGWLNRDAALRKWIS